MAKGELAPTPPELGAMRALAGDPGGALLMQEVPAAWQRDRATVNPWPRTNSPRPRNQPASISFRSLITYLETRKHER